MLIDKELPVSRSHVTDYFFFFNSVVTVHIKPAAPHHTKVLIASVKKNSTTRSFTRVISVRLSKNLAKDGTLAKSGRFTLFFLTVCKILSALIANFYFIFFRTCQMLQLHHLRFRLRLTG